tara:strand:- start:4729 stop:5034 length:306 start_codon:yes stop_codon:yes gene_type:complete
MKKIAANRNYRMIRRAWNRRLQRQLNYTPLKAGQTWDDGAVWDALCEQATANGSSFYVDENGTEWKISGCTADCECDYEDKGKIEFLTEVSNGAYVHSSWV